MKQAIRSEKICKAAEFCARTLISGEMPSKEFYRLLEESSGVSDVTFRRTKRIVNIKSRRKSGGWYMYIPDESKGKLMELIQEYRSNHPQHSNPIKIINSNPSPVHWTAVTVESKEETSTTKINIPRMKAQSGGLHVKVGGIEFEASADFPTENLIALLRGLGVEGVC